VDEYLRMNRALWNEWTGIHEKSAFYDVAAFKRGASRLHPFEIEEVGDVAGKDLLHLQCHFGMDTLSWARLGARVTGADFSPEALRLARSLAAELGLAANFVESELSELPAHLSAEFDVVYTGRGAVNWLPDLTRWAEVVAHFLRPDGVFYLHEGHPFVFVFKDEAVGPGELRVRYPYFPRLEPLKWRNERSYADPDAPVTVPFEYDWIHSLGEIVTAISRAGLRIEFLHEWPFLDWEMPFLVKRGDVWVLPEETHGEIPLSFSLRAVKSDGAASP
jgi:SAM-dependent methyltransferase